MTEIDYLALAQAELAKEDTPTPTEPQASGGLSSSPMAGGLSRSSVAEGGSAEVVENPEASPKGLSSAGRAGAEPAASEKGVSESILAAPSFRKVQRRDGSIVMEAVKPLPKKAPVSLGDEVARTG